MFCFLFIFILSLWVCTVCVNYDGDDVLSSTVLEVDSITTPVKESQDPDWTKSFVNHCVSHKIHVPNFMIEMMDDL